MVIKSLDVTNSQIQNFKANITGLVADPDVNSFILEFINQNWKIFLDQFLDQTKSGWEPTYLNIFNKIFGKIPFDQLMPKE